MRPIEKPVAQPQRLQPDPAVPELKEVRELFSLHVFDRCGAIGDDIIRDFKSRIESMPEPTDEVEPSSECSERMSLMTEVWELDCAFSALTTGARAIYPDHATSHDFHRWLKDLMVWMGSAEEFNGRLNDEFSDTIGAGNVEECADSFRRLRAFYDLFYTMVCYDPDVAIFEETLNALHVVQFGDDIPPAVPVRHGVALSEKLSVLVAAQLYRELLNVREDTLPQIGKETFTSLIGSKDKLFGGNQTTWQQLDGLAGRLNMLEESPGQCVVRTGQMIACLVVLPDELNDQGRVAIREGVFQIEAWKKLSGLAEHNGVSAFADIVDHQSHTLFAVGLCSDEEAIEKNLSKALTNFDIDENLHGDASEGPADPPEDWGGEVRLEHSDRSVTFVYDGQIAITAPLGAITYAYGRRHLARLLTDVKKFTYGEPEIQSIELDPSDPNRERSYLAGLCPCSISYRSQETGRPDHLELVIAPAQLNDPVLAEEVGRLYKLGTPGKINLMPLSGEGPLVRGPALKPLVDAVTDWCASIGDTRDVGSIEIGMYGLDGSTRDAVFTLPHVRRIFRLENDGTVRQATVDREALLAIARACVQEYPSCADKELPYAALHHQLNGRGIQGDGVLSIVTQFVHSRNQNEGASLEAIAGRLTVECREELLDVSRGDDERIQVVKIG